MAKSTSSLASSVCSVSSSSSASSTDISTDKTLGLRTSSSIDRRKRLAANARERKRMHLLNKAYDELRRRLVDANNKSKYEVLVQAKEYIQALATICEKFDLEQQETALRQNSNQLFGKCLDKSVLEDLEVQSSPMDMRASTTTTVNGTQLNSQSPIQKQHFPLLAHSTLIGHHLNYIQRHI